MILLVGRDWFEAPMHHRPALIELAAAANSQRNLPELLAVSLNCQQSHLYVMIQPRPRTHLHDLKPPHHRHRLIFLM